MPSRQPASQCHPPAYREAAGGIAPHRRQGQRHDGHAESEFSATPGAGGIAPTRGCGGEGGERGEGGRAETEVESTEVCGVSERLCERLPLQDDITLLICDMTH